MTRLRWFSVLLTLLSLPASGPLAVDPAAEVRGMTISCQTWGGEWGTDSFADELDELREMGVNWIAIHPYAWIRSDGALAWRELDVENPPEWLARPVREAKARGMSLLIKPHLGYWGSEFSWRGAIDYPDAADRERFFADYKRWIVQVAECTRGAAAFAVGTELALLNSARDDEHWREIIAAVREVTDAHLTYASNWDVFAKLGFWDALDVVGIQAYFPIAREVDPDDRALDQGWQKIVDELREFHERTGKPIVFTELGYNRSLDAAREPWSHRSASKAEQQLAGELQERLLRKGLEIMRPEREWLRGAFLWKWFAGEAPRANFMMDRPELRKVISEVWTAAQAENSEPGAPSQAR